MNTISPAHLLDVAVCAAEAAGNHALRNKQRRTETSETFAHDVKLVLDIECQQVAEEVISGQFPDHSILGEEGESPVDAAAYEWIIDPIDGTMNFSHGFHYWCSSIAVRHENQILAGCVYAPEFKEFYTACIDDDAKLNGKPIRVAEAYELQRAMVFSGLSKYMEDTGDISTDLFHALAVNTKKVRINGAAALDLCKLADGTCDGIVHMGLHIWDFAAASLIVERAGGELAAFRQHAQQQDYNVVAANPQLTPGLRNLYTKHL